MSSSSPSSASSESDSHSSESFTTSSASENYPESGEIGSELENSQDDEDSEIERPSGINVDSNFDSDNPKTQTKPPEIHIEDPNLRQYVYEVCGLTGREIEESEITSVHQVRFIKASLQLRFP